MAKMNYGVDSIKTLTQREAARAKFGMYIGDNGIRGLHHLVYEIISNSTDEMLNGFGDKIIVRLLEKAKIEIEDFGRGIPFGKNKEGNEVLEMIFTTLHSGGKMDNTKEGSGYKVSGGTNGVGTAVLNFLSTDLTIIVKREGKIAELVFKNGETDGIKMIGKCPITESGTKITFSPDFEIFSGLKGFDDEYIKSMLHDQSILQKSKLVFENGLTNEVITYENTEGIKKYIIDKNNESEVLENNDDDSDGEDQQKSAKKAITQRTEIISGEGLEATGPKNQYIAIDYAFEVIAENKSFIRGYTNSISNPDGGTHIMGFKAGIYKGVRNLIERTSSKAILKELTQEDLIGSVVGIINIKISDPIFEGQTKGKLGNDYVKSIINDIVAREVEKKFSDKDIDTICKDLTKKIDLRKKQVALEQATIEKINSESALLKKLGTKLTDANTKNRKDAELFIIEGDSAGGNLKKERNPDIHAIMPLKGKGLNVLNDKNKDKIFSNQEVNNLMYAISSGYVGDEFDINKHLRYGKIVILADADVDGLHISLLVLSIIIKFYPILIEKGHIYLGISPLFVCKYKDDYKYFYTEGEKDRFVKTVEGKKYTTARFKGLGEMDSEDLEKVALGKSRTLVKVTMEDAEEAKSFFSMIMGKDPRAKFEFVQQYIESFLKRLEKNEVFDARKSKDIIEVAKDNMTMYQKDVNEERATVAVEDGLKVVHRRILYGLTKRLNSTSNGTFIKSARIVGEVMGILHPHGDASIFDAMVGITQDFSNNHPLIQGKGAFGSLFGKGGVAAPRYSEARIAEISENLLLKDIQKNAVPFVNNYDDTTVEPTILPAVLPFSLLLDNFGIGAAGVSSGLVAHNIREVIQAVKAYIETNGKNFTAIEYIKGPDVPSGNILLNTANEIKEIYESQNGGTFVFRVPINIEKDGRNNILVINEVPYFSYNAEGVINKINDFINKDVVGDRILGVKSVADKSGKKGTKKELRIVITVNQEIDINLIIEDLYKKTSLQDTFRYNPVMVNRHGKPRRYTLNEIIAEFVEFRKETLTNIFTYEVEKLKRELNTLNAKRLFSANIDAIVKIIKEGNKRDEIKKAICQKFKIDDEAAEIIITTQLISIKDIKVIEDKIKIAEKELKGFEKLLNNPKAFKKYMLDEYEALYEKYKNVRRKTKLLSNKEINEIKSLAETLERKKKEEKNKIDDKPVGIVITKTDFIMKIGGKEDTIATKIKELADKDLVKHAHICSNALTLFIITNKKQGYFAHIHKMKDKEDTAVNRLIKGFDGDVVGSFVYGENFTDSELMVIYEDDKKTIGGYRIAKSDLAKSKQGYNLGKNTILFAGETKEVELSKIINLARYNYKKDIKIVANKLPLKKSPSSGVKI